MTNKDYLFLLIKSLTKSEKGYYKKFAARHSIVNKNKYLLLFDEIEKQASKGIYNEQKIKQLFINEKFIKNFPSAKAYLYKTILRSLNSYYSFLNKDNELREALKNIEILYRKTLYKQAQKLVNRAKKEAVKYDNFLILIELIKWEKNLIHEGTFKGDRLKNLEQAYIDEQSTLDIIKNLSDYRFLSYKTQNLAAKIFTPEINSGVTELLSHPLISDISNALSYPAMINFYHIRSALFEIMNDRTSAYLNRKKMTELMESNPAKIQESRINYIISLHNLLNSCSSLNLFDEFNYYLNKLRSVVNGESEGISENIKVLTFIGPALLELKMFINSGKYKNGLICIPGIINGMKEYKGKINKIDEIHCMYLIADIYFRNGNYENALFWLNKILDEKENGNTSEIFINTRIFLLLVHFELGNTELLEYLIISTYRFLKKRRNLDKAEKVVLKFLRNIPSIIDNKELAERFSEAKNELELISKQFPELHLFRYFDFIEYLNLKLKGLSIT